ncbi:site-2 protease family protein [Olsenella phocaeensis]|uniref:site-2 protease family protein n=1 Tax=Olsenella phocaeensis TaxID=1852385 RepID=UPI000931CE0A|nr:site-2 protease family protein [Olsenella phocaeensis]
MSAGVGVLSSAFWGVLVLSLLVFVHEGGHFLAARACGMRVTEFFLGMPSRWRLSWRSPRIGCEFGVTPLLLGGYTRICGMEPLEDELLAPCLSLVQRRGRVSAREVAEELAIEEDRAYALLGSLADLAAIAPLYDPELGERPGQADWPQRFQTQRRDAMLLTQFDRGHDFEAVGTTGEGEARPVDDAEAFLASELSRTYHGKGLLARLATLVAGPLVNLLLAFLVITVALSLVGVEGVVDSNQIAGVTAGSAAEAVGLRGGDAIVDVAGTPVSDWRSLSAALDAALGAKEDFSLSYLRDGRTSTVRVEVGEGLGSLGVLAQTQRVRLGVGQSALAALSYGRAVARFALDLITPARTMQTLQGTSSVVGISAMASQAASSGAYDLALFVAMISMSLGFMNLLPIPPLDGGKVLVELVQATLRRELSSRAQTVVGYLGIAVFLVIFVFALKNDITRLVIG